MPELPEVQTTINGLKPIINCKILNIKINTPKLRFFIPKNITRINTETIIIKIKRKGKYILIYLSNNYVIVIHLGMSGRLRLITNNKLISQKHDHFIMRTNEDHYMIFNDSRRFGFVDYDKKEIIHQKKYLINLGKEALSRELTVKYLFSKISKSTVPIKQILLDQRVIAGIGNIYASEILYNAKISPMVRGKELTLDDIRRIIISIKKILKKAINLGGSTLRDFVSADGTVGNFQNNFKVYNKSGQKILGKPIKKIVQYGRSTFYCPAFQKKV